MSSSTPSSSFTSAASGGPRFLHIKLPCTTSLYDPTVFEDLSKALDLVKAQMQQSDYDVIIFEQPASGSDYHSEWVKNTSTLLFHELSEHLHLLRALIKNILRSPLKTGYVFRGDCFDSFFELAMATDFRVAYDNRGQVGFPQIEKGFYPGGGLFDRLDKMHPLTKFDWRKRTKFGIDEAIAVGLVNGCFVSDVASVAQTLHRRPKTTIPSQFDAGAEGDTNTEAFSPVKFAEMTKGYSDLGFITHLIQKPQKIVQRFDNERKYRGFLRSLSAYQYLTQKYQTYVKRNITYVRNQTYEPQLFSIIYIELEEVIPPADFIATMLARANAICFYCTQIELLQSNLSLLYDRLGALQNSVQPYQRWAQKARWLVGVPAAEDCLHISYHADRRVTFTYGDKQADFYAVDVHGAIAEVHPTKDRWETNFYHLFGLVLELPSDVFKEISLATYLRSFFFEEMLRYAQKYSIKLAYLIQCLGDRGWSFAGTHQAWETFLSSRHILSDLPPEPLAGFQLSSRLWAIESLHAAYFENKRQLKAATEKTPIEIDFHFRYLAGVASLILADKVLSRDSIKSELFVSEILGFPAEEQMPLDAMRYSQISTQSYVAQNWPKYLGMITDGL